MYLRIFVQRSRADRPQFAARQRRLQHVGSVHRAFRRARAHQRVQLVNEQNDLSVGFGDFLQHRFQPVFEFAAVFRAGDQRRKIERNDALRLQHFGHVAGNDAACKAFDDRRFAHARLADQHRIILRAPRQDLHHAPDFFVAPDHRIELAAPCQFGQVAPVLLQRAKGGFGILRSHAVAAANRGHRLQNRVVRRALPAPAAGPRDPFGCGNRQQNMFGGNVLVFQSLRFVERALQDLVRRMCSGIAAETPETFGRRVDLLF